MVEVVPSHTLVSGNANQGSRQLNLVTPSQTNANSLGYDASFSNQNVRVYLVPGVKPAIVWDKNIDVVVAAGSVRDSISGTKHDP